MVEHPTSIHKAQVQPPVMKKKQRRTAKRTEPCTFAALRLPLAGDRTTGTYLNSPGPKCHLQAEQLGQMLYKAFPSMIFYVMMSA